jgi:hypothetical protein
MLQNVKKFNSSYSKFKLQYKNEVFKIRNVSLSVIQKIVMIAA